MAFVYVHVRGDKHARVPDLYHKIQGFVKIRTFQPPQMASEMR